MVIRHRQLLGRFKQPAAAPGRTTHNEEIQMCGVCVCVIASPNLTIGMLLTRPPPHPHPHPSHYPTHTPPQACFSPAHLHTHTHTHTHHINVLTSPPQACFSIASSCSTSGAKPHTHTRTHAHTNTHTQTHTNINKRNPPLRLASHRASSCSTPGASKRANPVCVCVCARMCVRVCMCVCVYVRVCTINMGTMLTATVYTFTSCAVVI